MDVPSDPGVPDVPNSDGDAELQASAPSDMSRFLFFARCPPAVPYDDLLSLFQKYGPVKHLNLYRRWASAKTSKGCGMVEFDAVGSAAAALQALNGKHTFDGYPGCEAPMVLEPMDPSRMTAASSDDKPKKQTKRASSTTSRSTSVSHSSCSSKASQSKAQHHRSALAHWGAGGPAAAAGWQGLLPCDAFSQAVLLRQQADAAAADAAAAEAAAAEAAAAAWSAELGDPSTWTSYTPVHLLPMMGCTAPPMLQCSPHVPNYSPLMSPLAAAASAAAADALAAHAMSTMGGNMPTMEGHISPDLLMQATLSPLSATRALMMHDMALNHASSQLAAFDMNSSGSQLLPLAGSSCLPGGNTSSQAPLPAQLAPLVLADESSWAQDTFVASLRSGSGALASPGSDGYSLWETSAALGCLHDALHSSSAAAVSGHTCPSPTGGLGSCLSHSINSGSVLSAPAAFLGQAAGGSRHEGTLSGVLRGGLQGLLSPQPGGAGWQCGRSSSLGDCLSTSQLPGVLSAASAPDAINTSAMRDQGLLQQQQSGRCARGVEVHVSTPLSMEAGESVLHVAAVTGAHITLTEWPRLWLQGSDAQVKAACELLGGSAAGRPMGPA